MAEGLIEKSKHTIIAATGTDVLPGTVNVWLDKPVALNNRYASRISNPRFLYWPALLHGVPVWVQRYDRGVLHIFELVADRNLRKELGLADGSRVTLELNHKYILPMPYIGRVVWAIFWFGRGRRHLISDRYRDIVCKFCRRFGATQDSVHNSSLKLVCSVLGEVTGRVRDRLLNHELR